MRFRRCACSQVCFLIILVLSVLARFLLVRSWVVCCQACLGLCSEVVWVGIYWPWVVLVSCLKDVQASLAFNFRYFQVYAFITRLGVFPLSTREYGYQSTSRLSLAILFQIILVKQLISVTLTDQSKVLSRIHMANSGVDKLVVHLENSMDLSAMEQGVKLLGKALTSKSLNMWGYQEHSQLCLEGFW